MRKIFQILIIAILVLLGGWIYLYLEIDPILLNLILLNIIVYIIRTTLVKVTNYYLRGKVLRYIFSMIINIVWAAFLLSLLFYVTPEFSVAVISFLVIAISLTFRERIDNLTSGILILSAESFEIGDLIETNGVQGRVEDITLNYTKMRDLNGITNYLSNINVYGAPIKLFSSKIMQVEDGGDEDEPEGSKYHIKDYVKKVSGFIPKEQKITRYIRIVEILPKIEPRELKAILDKVFSKYEPIFGGRPFYYVNTTSVDRGEITLQIISDDPKKVVYYVNAFLRDVIFALYPEDIKKGWDSESVENENVKKLVEEII